MDQAARLRVAPEPGDRPALEAAPAPPGRDTPPDTRPWLLDGPRMTWEEAQATRFDVAAWPRRGYDQDTVDAFTARATLELQALTREKATLLDEVARLRQRFITTGGDAEPGRAWPADVDAREFAADIVTAAQQVSDRQVREARQNAAALLEDARAQRERLLADAGGHADRIVADAEQYAADLRASRVLAESLLAMLTEWQARSREHDATAASRARSRTRART